MEKFEILLWAIGGGFAGTWAMMFWFMTSIKSDIQDLRKDIQDMDRRLCRLEGAFAAKDFCVLRHTHGKAEGQ